jgi:hypothetical protein
VLVDHVKDEEANTIVGKHLEATSAIEDQAGVGFNTT